MFQSLDCDSTHSSDVIVEHPVLQYLSVQNTSKISKHELDYVNERYKKTKDALKKLLPKGTNIKYVSNNLTNLKKCPKDCVCV